MHFSVLVLVSDSITYLGLLWPLFKNCGWHSLLKYLQRIPCKSYGSRYTSLKTDFCPHLGSQTKVPSCFTLWAGSSSHTSNLVSSPGCDSVMLCAHPGILLIGISTRGQFSLPAGRKRQKVIMDFIEGCSKRSFYDRFPFFSYDPLSNYKASHSFQNHSCSWTILWCYIHGDEAAKAGLKLLTVVSLNWYSLFPTGLAGVV